MLNLRYKICISEKEFEDAENRDGIGLWYMDVIIYLMYLYHFHVQLSNMLANYKENSKDDTWSDRLNSLKSSNEVVEISK